MPFNNLSIDSLLKLCNSLKIDILNKQLLLPSQHAELAYKERIQSRIMAALNTPNSELFIQLLTHIQDNPKDAMVIFEDECCQNILIKNRPKNLPHWLLSLMESQQNLALHLLQMDQYSNDLTREECTFLTRNYPVVQELAIKNLISESNNDDNGFVAKVV
jgi:hypothetical protein